MQTPGTRLSYYLGYPAKSFNYCWLLLRLLGLKCVLRICTFNLANCRAIPIDMAGFAITSRLLLEKPDVLFGQNVHGQMSKTGYLESDFLEHFATRNSVQCLGSETEVCGYIWCVWHIRSNLWFYGSIKVVIWLEVHRSSMSISSAVINTDSYWY